MNSRRSVFSLAAVCFVALLACRLGEPDNPHLKRFSVTVSQDGTQIRQECLFMPSLLGSRTEYEFPVTSGLMIQVDATRDRVHVITRGASPNLERTVGYEELDEGYAEEFDLLVQGSAFRMNLSSYCGKSDHQDGGDSGPDDGDSGPDD